MENVDPSILKSTTYINAEFIGVCGELWPARTKAQPIPYYIAKSSNHDAADVLAMLLCMKLLVSDAKVNDIVLLTRDHFGSAFNDIVSTSRVFNITKRFHRFLSFDDFERAFKYNNI
jgi:hypothetical protein